MRTTLDIDPRVLAAARGEVKAKRSRSVGEEVSRFALAGLAPREPAPATSGLLILPAVAGHVITDEMVAEALADA